MAKPFWQLPTAGWIVSNALALTSPNFHRKVYETAEEHGGLVKMYAPGRTIVAVSDPKVLAEVVAQEFDGVTKPEDLYKTLAVLCSDRRPDPVYPLGATDNYTQWDTIRKGFEAAFSPQAVKQYVPTLSAEAAKVLDQITSDTELDIQDLMARISVSTTGRMMFNHDFECTDLKVPFTFLQELVIARQGAVDAARSPLVGLQYRLCPFSKAAREYNQNLKAVHEELYEIYSSVEAAATPTRTPARTSAGSINGTAANGFGSGSSPTIVSAFHTTPDWQSPGDIMSKDDTIATIGNFVFAGTMSIATATTYTLCLLGCSPDVQKRVQDEVDKAGLGKRPFEVSDVDKLPYLSNVIKEATRVNTIVPQVNRATTKEIQLGGYMIPKGVTLFLSLGGIHTSKHNYTDPDKFWPERWEVDPAKFSPGEDPAAGPRATPAGNADCLEGSYVPFSSGSRNCLGLHWAKLAMLGTVATVMAKFTVTSPRSMSVESLAAGEIFSLSITSKTPLKLSFTPRK